MELCIVYFLCLEINGLGVMSILMLYIPAGIVKHFAGVPAPGLRGRLMPGAGCDTTGRTRLIYPGASSGYTLPVDGAASAYRES